MALQAQRIFIETAGKCKKPSLNEIQKLIKPTQEEITQVIQIKDSNRPSPFFGHLSVLAEGIPALGWVLVVCDSIYSILFKGANTSTIYFRL